MRPANLFRRILNLVRFAVVWSSCHSLARNATLRISVEFESDDLSSHFTGFLNSAIYFWCSRSQARVIHFVQKWMTV